MSLTARQQRYVTEYLIDLNETQAAIRAGYSAATAQKNAHRLMANEGVKSAIAAALEARKKRTEITQDEVLKRFWMIASADPNEIVEYRRTCCRYCHGKGHRYQRTRGEIERDRATHKALVAKHQKDVKQPDPGVFDVQGGDGYDARKAPHPECPECFGEGVGGAHVKDTRHLSPAARALYAGVKETGTGLDVKLNDQHAALINVARHLGLFKEDGPHPDRQKIDISKLTDEQKHALLALIRLTRGG